jgi:hypothetical protein
LVSDFSEILAVLPLNQRPIMNAQNAKKATLIFSCVILAVGYITVLVWPSIVEGFLGYATVLFCFACAGLASFLPGKFTWKRNGVIATSALGIFIFLLYWLKKPSQPVSDPFFMVRVHVEKDKLIPEELPDGIVILTLGDEPRHAPLSAAHDATFEHIPCQYLGIRAKLDISFNNKYALKYPNLLYKLERDKLITLVLTLDLKNKIYGTVFDSKGKVLHDVAVSVDTNSTSTNRFGFYILKLDTTDLQDDQEILFLKSGYKTGRQLVHLRSLGRFDMTLDKEK